MDEPGKNDTLPWDPGEDVEEYSVLPPDPEVLDAERRRRDAQIAEWESKAATESDFKDPVWDTPLKFQFRFGVKDLLAVMSILAATFTCAKLLDPCTGFSVCILGCLVWMQYRLVCAEKEAARTKKYSPQPQAAPVQKMNWGEWIRSISSYSVADLLIAITVAACVFALLDWLGVALTTALLGMAVTAGILAYLLDYRPPRQWWLVWILVCLCYVVFAICTSIKIRFFS